VYVGHDDASSTYLIYFPSTDHTRVVGTPNFIEDVDAYTSRLIDSTSVPALPVDPTEIFYDKPAPFHDTVNQKTNRLTSSASELGTAMRITSSSPWCSCDQPAATSCSQLRPAATSQSQTVTLFGPL
jgi:hypothetical protein